VRLPLELIDRLEHQTVESFRSLTSRGSEIGGLLLGGITTGNPAMVTVEDFELIQCDYSRGPLYRLSEADMSRFERAIEQHGSGAGLRVTGFFRSHTRKGLSLDAEDLAFFETRFHDSHHIILLVRPFATKASAAGIFIRENGRISGDASLLEFPFRSSELGGGSRRLGVDAAPSAALQSQAAADQPANKAPVRAQIVPIAPRREMPAPEPEVKPVQPNPPAPQPVAAAPAAKSVPATAPPAPPVARVSPVAPPAPKVAPAPPAPAAKTTQPAPKVAPAPQTPPAKVAPAPVPAAKIAPAAPATKAAPAEPAKKKEEEKAKEKVVAPPAPASKVQESAPIFSAVGGPAVNKNKKVRLMVAAALGMLVLVGGFLFVYPALLHRGAAPTTTAQQDSSALGLRIEHTSGGLLLTWNNRSAVIQHAAKVVLSITDGDRHENIEMDPNQVRTGSIVYPPISGDVSFQMEVADVNQTRTTSESLRWLDPRPSPLATTPAPAVQGPQVPTGPQITAAKTTGTDGTDPTSADPSAKPPEAAAVRNPTPVKQFDKESLAQRLRPAAPTELADAPAEVRANAATPGNLGSIMSGAASAPAAPARPTAARSADTGASAAATNGTSGGQIIPAEPLFKKAPEYPKAARQLGAGGVVEIEAIIGADGKVKNPKVLKGNPMLQKAAIDAVLEWRYKPALLNGKPVESPVQIKLNFTSER
jgi:TonB family protein